MSPKVVVNDKKGGKFGLSDQAMRLYKKLGGGQDDVERIKRDDPILVAVVEQMGSAANAEDAFLKILDAPEQWILEEYKGQEWVNEIES